MPRSYLKQRARKLYRDRALVAAFASKLARQGYVRNLTVVGQGGKTYRLAFANAELRHSVEVGRGSPQRDAAVRALGWHVTRFQGSGSRFQAGQDKAGGANRAGRRLYKA